MPLFGQVSIANKSSVVVGNLVKNKQEFLISYDNTDPFGAVLCTNISSANRGACTNISSDLVNFFPN